MQLNADRNGKRETGFVIPGTKDHVEFIYRLVKVDVHLGWRGPTDNVFGHGEFGTTSPSEKTQAGLLSEIDRLGTNQQLVPGPGRGGRWVETAAPP